MAIKLQGNSGTVAEVNASNEVKVALSNTAANIGGVRMFSENDSASNYLKSPETSTDYRLRVGIDTVLFTDTFNATTQNTNKWSYTFATLTAAQAGAGTVNFSTVQGTTSAHGAFMRTFQYYPLIGTAPLSVEVSFGQFTAALVSGEVWLCGLGIPTAATTIPTDGVFVRLTTAGLEGVIKYNNTETSTGVIKSFGSFTVGEIFKIAIVVGEGEVEYWMDDVLLGEQTIPAANGQPFIAGSLPAFMMKYNTGAVSNTNTMRVSSITISLMDLATNKSWPAQMAVAGQGSYVGQNGHTQGSTCGGFSQSAIAATAAGSNTSANVTGLGGLGVMTAQATNAGAAGDMIATSYQNPASTINISGRNLIIHGVSISCMNTGAAVATTPTSLIWGLAFGHTAVSLATTETGSFATATTHSPRRIPLGMTSAAIGTVVGGMYDKDIRINFECPIVVRPGEFIATTVRFRIGTATASQELTYIVQFDGYFE